MDQPDTWDDQLRLGCARQNHHAVQVRRKGQAYLGSRTVGLSM